MPSFIEEPVPIDCQTPTSIRPITPKRPASSQDATHNTPDIPLSRHSTSKTTVQHAADTQDIRLPPQSPSATSPNACLDPLSTQIYLRKNSAVEPTIGQRLLNTAFPDAPTPDPALTASPELAQSPSFPLDVNSKGKKGPSFLSRLGMRGSRRRDDDELDSDSELGELRTDGTNARVLTSAAGAGYIPLYKEPPRYIRVKSHNKKDKEFNHLFLAQELTGSKPESEQETKGRAPATAVGSKILKGGDAIWAAEFSLDGKYLAVAGKDQIVRVFAVISTPEERKAHEEEEEQNGTCDERLSAPVFRSKPVREFRGHTGEVLALSWSKNNFLLSSSMDKSVRLWHMSRSDSLCTFNHKDLVTSIAFHPTDDRFFLAGSLDAQLRLWSIPDKSVAFSASTSEFITAVAFTPDGKVAICGVLSGMCTFYSTEGLKLKYQIHVRSSRGKNAKGSKITGIRTMTVPSGPEAGTVKVVISSNDSRVRVYNLNDKVVQAKYKGLENQSSQIHARFSDDGTYIISGSEDRMAYIWRLDQDSEIRDKQPFECFDAHPEVVTTALIAPTKSRLLLQASGDPIYDLCNPPPVTLRSLEESTASQSAQSASPSEDGDSTRSSKRPEETPAYLERSKHLDGNIIITTDRTGKIKVFRQDCACIKRQQSLWETGSRFSGRIVCRSGSIMTRTSTGSRVHSRRGSLSLAGTPVQPQHASDRINSWRQDVDGGRDSWHGGTLRRERSLSPVKGAPSPLNVSKISVASDKRKTSLSSPTRSQHRPTSATSSSHSNQTTVQRDTERAKMTPIMSPPVPSFNMISAVDSEDRGDRDPGFWTLSRWKSGLKSPSMSILSSPGSESPAIGSPNLRGTNELSSPRQRGLMSRLSISDLNRPRSEEKTNRRKSTMPSIMSKSPLGITGLSRTESDTVVEVDEEPMPTKKRVDSGVRLTPETELIPEKV